MFRIYYPMYAEVRKFKRWLKVNVNYFNGPDINQLLDEKFGKLDDYSDLTKERKEETVVGIFNYTPEYFHDKDEPVIFKRDPIGNILNI